MAPGQPNTPKRSPEARDPTSELNALRQQIGADGVEAPTGRVDTNQQLIDAADLRLDTVMTELQTADGERREALLDEASRLAKEIEKREVYGETMGDLGGLASDLENDPEGLNSL